MTGRVYENFRITPKEIKKGIGGVISVSAGLAKHKNLDK